MATKYAKVGQTEAYRRAAKKALDKAPNKTGYCLREQSLIRDGELTVYDFDRDGHYAALDYWLASAKKGKVVRTSDPMKIPPGALTFWDRHFGHVATGAGGGYVFSTDRPNNGRWGKVSIESINRAWGKKLLGYVEVDWRGLDLRDKPQIILPENNYHEVTVAVLNGRTAPSTSAKVKVQRKRGYRIHTVGYIDTPTERWHVGPTGTWYAGLGLVKVS